MWTVDNVFGNFEKLIDANFEACMFSEENDGELTSIRYEELEYMKVSEAKTTPRGNIKSVQEFGADYSSILKML
jgi:hypothetical protein